MIQLNVEKFLELQGDMTDVDMAKKLNISRTQLWRIKNQKTGVGEKFIAAFMKEFPNETIDDYFFTNDVAFLERYNTDTNTA